MAMHDCSTADDQPATGTTTYAFADTDHITLEKYF